LKNGKTSRAIKIIPKNKVKSQEIFTKEVDILRTLVSLYFSFHRTILTPSKFMKLLRIREIFTSSWSIIISLIG